MKSSPGFSRGEDVKSETLKSKIPVLVFKGISVLLALVGYYIIYKETNGYVVVG